MELERLVVPIEWKAVGDDDQVLEGYASTFGNVDLGGDVVVKGAFTKTIANINSNGIPLLADHVASTASVLGTIFWAKEDDHGLKIKARFSKAPSAQDVRTKLLEGHLGKLSIGYETMDDANADRDGRRVRLLQELKLWETSVVVFPMNTEAAVSRVKSMVETLSEDGRKQLVEALTVAPTTTDPAPVEQKMTSNELRDLLSKAVREHYKGSREYAWLRDFDGAKVWYEVYSSGSEKVYERGYETDDNDRVTLAEGATEVRAVIKYIPVSETDEKKGTTLTRGATKDSPGDEPGGSGDEPEKKADDPAATPSDEPGDAPDDGAVGWHRYASEAVLNGRDPEAVIDGAKRAGLTTRMDLLDQDIERNRKLLADTSAVQLYETTVKE